MDDQRAQERVKERVNRWTRLFDVDDQRNPNEAFHHSLLHVLSRAPHPVNWTKKITVVEHNEIGHTHLLPEFLNITPPRAPYCYVGSSGFPAHFRTKYDYLADQAQFFDLVSPHPVTKGRKHEKDAYEREIQKREQALVSLLQREWGVVVLDLTCVYSRTDMAIVDRVLDRVEKHWASNADCLTRILVLV